VLNLLAELRDRLDLAMLFISHDLGVIAHLAGRIAVIYGGKVIELGPAAEVLRPPYHPYTEALLSAVPVIGHRLDQRALQRSWGVDDSGEAAGAAGLPTGGRLLLAADADGRRGGVRHRVHHLLRQPVARWLRQPGVAYAGQHGPAFCLLTSAGPKKDPP